MRIDNFSGTDVIHWFSILLGIHNFQGIPDILISEDKLLIYSVIIMKRLWLLRNQIRLRGPKPDWRERAVGFVFTFNVYWKVGARKRRNNRKVSSQDE